MLAVIERNSVALPAAYRDWDLNGLGEYLTGDELIQRATDIQNMIFRGNEIWFEQRSFEVTAIDFPEPNRASMDTVETWYEWVNIGGEAAEREWVGPESYELQSIDGRWYISRNEILGVLPDFTPIPPTVAEPARTPPRPPAAVPSSPRPPSPPTPTRACCRVCRTGKACGNSCIAASLNCRQPAGCACNGGLGPGYVWASEERLLAGNAVYEELAAVELGPSDCDVLADYYERGVGKWAAVPI